MGRPTIQTPEKAQKIIDALELHPSKSRACRTARISRAALYAWCASDSEFKARVDAAQERGIDAVEDALLNDAINHDTTAAIFALKSWRPARYRETQRHEVTGKDGEALTITIAQRPDGPPEQ